jgi:hypothetical protein
LYPAWAVLVAALAVLMAAGVRPPRSGVVQLELGDRGGALL